MEQLSFGKHYGKTLSEVPVDYVVWLAGYQLREGTFYRALDLEVEHVWNNRESLLSSCFCGNDVPIGKHDSNCYGFVLRETQDATRAALIECGLNKTATFRYDGTLKAWMWVNHNHPEMVTAANDFLSGKCFVCGGRLVPIGTARSNGRTHDDWDTRKMHKKCWRSANDE